VSRSYTGRVRTVIEGATVLTVNASDAVLPSGWLDVRDGEIAAVSATPIDPAGADQRIDATGKVVMPGLVNAHTHLYQTLIRGVYEEMPFTEWLRVIYHCGRVLTPDDCFIGARLGALEALRSGVTTLLDHHFLNRGIELAEATIAGMQAIGLRAVLARTIMDVGDLAPAEVVESPEQGLRSVEALLDRFAGQTGAGLLTLMTGPNTPGASASGELAQATRAFADRYGLGQSMHLAESASLLRAVRERTGTDGIAAWLDELGALGPRLVAAHSVHVAPHEIQTLARRGVAVAHNPISNLFLGDGIAPVVEMLAAGVNVALGTDGAASNNSQDMFEVLKMAPLLQRARTQDPHAISPRQALRMATINGAQALGLDHLVGSLEPGKRADLIVLDLYAAAHNVAVHNVVSHVVHCVRPSDVQLVMVDGRVLMEQGQLPDLDEPRLLAEAQDVGEDLVQRLAA
jgi:5-methylthioadenosine/S-adenosylhomocysteine deaminase